MSFRLRVFLAILLPAVGVLLGIGWWGRTQLLHRLETSFQDRFDADVRLVEEELRRIEESMAFRLHGASEYLVDDARFRVALLSRDDAEKRLLVDAAGHVQPLTGLDVFEILAADGRVLSSGHFRESHGQNRGAILQRVDAGKFLARTRTARETKLVWAYATPMEIAGTRYVIWGGVEQRKAGPTRDGGDSQVSWTNGAVPAATGVPPVPTGHRHVVRVPFVDLTDGALSAGDPFRSLVLTANADSWLQAQADMQKWLGLSLGLVALAALVLSGIISRWIERPVRELIDHTLQVRIGRPNLAPASSRKDEFGDLARFIDSMVTRLRVSGEELRHAERKATQGEMARQVHHDVKNGVLPLAGVVRHLKEVAENEPEQLATVYRDRVGTLETGLDYLENLTRQYAKISSRGATSVVDVETVLRSLVDVLHLESRAVHLMPRAEAEIAWRDAPAEVRGESEATEGACEVEANAVDLRRIFENLVRNAMEAVTDSAMSDSSELDVRISSLRVRGNGRDWVVVEVRDNGPGMSAEVQARVFEPFYTTKELGTGLGLAISRRLVTDIGGRLQISSREGAGTSCFVRLPAGTNVETEVQSDHGNHSRRR